MRQMKAATLLCGLCSLSFCLVGCGDRGHIQGAVSEEIDLYGGNWILCGTVTGIVGPVADATITVELGGQQRNEVTDSAGYYELSNLPDGSYRLTVVAEGYGDYVADAVDIEGSDEVFDVYLSPYAMIASQDIMTKNFREYGGDYQWIYIESGSTPSVGLFRFDLGPLVGSPSGAVFRVDARNLSLQSTLTTTLKAYAVPTSLEWSESDGPGDIGIDTFAARTPMAVTDLSLDPQEHQWVEFPVSSTVIMWLAGARNNGFAVTSTSSQYIAVPSSECLPESEYRPELVFY
jgi:hypothetical protein